MSEVFHNCSRIPYLRLGAGEPLVLIHGLGEIKEGWENYY
ncbi:hypothetical protein BAVI_07319 [Neobacillus vireti LMG 21834]|uniref:Alpha/beta hydrolase n=1 Tax=Neobacillus vireti LMG 21834 TaxID=1131730 RepID=A0AB94IR41_9BACI|nr:hypothetical protein BAVI_07319 [Neobacillus vireti LMG 21834]